MSTTSRTVLVFYVEYCELAHSSAIAKGVNCTDDVCMKMKRRWQPSDSPEVKPAGAHRTCGSSIKS